jgi:hypothetical protein
MLVVEETHSVKSEEKVFYTLHHSFVSEEQDIHSDASIQTVLIKQPEFYEVGVLFVLEAPVSDHTPCGLHTL